MSIQSCDLKVDGVVADRPHQQNDMLLELLGPALLVDLAL